jgi:hypothetical protein
MNMPPFPSEISNEPSGFDYLRLSPTALSPFPPATVQEIDSAEALESWDPQGLPDAGNMPDSLDTFEVITDTQAELSAASSQWFISPPLPPSIEGRESQERQDIILNPSSEAISTSRDPTSGSTATRRLCAPTTTVFALSGNGKRYFLSLSGTIIDSQDSSG